MSKKLFSNPALAVEGYGVQGSGAFIALTEWTNKVRSSCKTVKDFQSQWGLAKELEAIVMKFTGIKIKLDYKPYVWAIEPPLLSNQTAIADDFFNAIFVSRDFNKLKGYVDETQKRVGGDFSNLECKMYYEPDLLGDVTAESIAASILHECGHVYTFALGVTRSVADNMRLVDTFKRLTNTEDPAKRTEIIIKSEGIRDSSVKKKEIAAALAESRNGSEYLTIAVAEYKTLDNNLNNDYYTKFNAEIAADEFAMYHGVGIGLADGLDPYYKHTAFNKEKKITRLLLTACDFVKCLFLLAFPVITAGSLVQAATGFGLAVVKGAAIGAAANALLPFILAAAFVMLAAYFGLSGLAFDANGLNDDEHPTPMIRFKYMRDFLAKQLKKQNMSPADAKAILKDIADLDVLINKYDDKRNPMFAAIGRYLFKGVRNDRAIEDLHRDLEDLTANQFFVDAAKFRTL